MDKTCGTCRFCGPRNPEHRVERFDGGSYDLVCRIRAPGPHGFIFINEYDWCGEHTPKEPPHAG